jgi:hypothetical protein
MHRGQSSSTAKVPQGISRLIAVDYDHDLSLIEIIGGNAPNVAPVAGHYHRQKELHAIDGVFHLLDGKGPIKTYTGPLETAIQNAEEGKGETDYFKFKCQKNHNLHLEFKRLDLVKELNLLATGEHVIGRDME